MRTIAGIVSGEIVPIPELMEEAMTDEASEEGRRGVASGHRLWRPIV